MAAEGRITEADISQAEKETLSVASSTITALESALASWEASKDKPEGMADKFRSYAWFRDELAAWMKGMLHSGKGSLRERQKKLSEFAAICRKYRRLA